MSTAAKQLPEGHPLSWDQLVPYEQEQGGYWLYPKGCDVYGNGKIWVSVPRPEQDGELAAEVRRVRLLAQQVSKRAKETGNSGMTALAEALDRAAGATAAEASESGGARLECSRG